MIFYLQSRRRIDSSVCRITLPNVNVPYSRRIVLWSLLALFCLPLITHIYLGSYNRLLADDFCSASIARSQGILRGTIYWYTTWTGRFSANFFDTLFGYLRAGVTPFATGLVVTLWFVVLAIAVAQIVHSDDKREVHLLQSCIIAAMILFAVLYVIPFIGQSLYWGQGMRSVVPPLILGTAYIALIANRSKSSAPAVSSPWWFFAAAGLTLVAAGFAETYTPLQTATIVFALVISATFKRYAPRNRRTWFGLLIAGLAGSLIGGLIMFIAPGNKIRQGTFPPHPALLDLLSISFRGMREFFELVVVAPGKWFAWAGLILCSFIFGVLAFKRREGTSASPRRPLWILLWFPLVGFVLLLACWVPMAWATSLILAYRTLIIPTYVLVCLVSCWAFIAGRACGSGYALFARRTPVIAATAPLLGLLTFGAFAAYISREMWQLRSTYAGYARVWDEREQLIQRAKSQGLSYAVVYRLHNWAALDEVAVDPKITWLTKCVQDYYGIGVIPDLGDLFGEPDGEAKQAALVRQFDTIPKLPGSVPTQLDQIYKTLRGKIGFYKTDQSPDQIKSHYENELARLGWKHVGERKIETPQVVDAGTQNLFCNGEVAASLFITGGDEARLGYTYSLALNWGMSSGFTWGVVDCLPNH